MSVGPRSTQPGAAEDVPGKTLINDITIREVLVRLDPPLQSASGEVGDMPMLLLDVRDNDGVVGSSYLIFYVQPVAAAVRAYASALADMMVGFPAAPRTAIKSLSTRSRLLGRRGLSGWVLGALDLALWDAAAWRANMPLVRLLGATPTAVPAYASLRSADPEQIANEAATFAEAGFNAFKVKIGHAGVDQDLAAVRAVRDGAGPNVTVMVDYNQSLTVRDAITRASALADAGVAWLEEPVSAEDTVGHARIAKAVDIPIQLGENWQGLGDVSRSISASASDLAMFDAMNIGGVTGWLAAAALTDAAALPVSSHLFCEVSAHLLPVTPGSQWLEWLDVAGPILACPAVPSNGFVTAGERPGSGVEWDEDAVKMYEI